MATAITPSEKASSLLVLMFMGFGAIAVDPVVEYRAMTGPLEKTIRVQLRWRDMDMLGHLNQSVYHELLEEGRAALMTEIISRAGLGRSYGSFVLVHVDLDYRTEVRKDHGEVAIVMRLGRVGTSSLTFEHEVQLPDGTVAASGKTVMVAWDAARRGKRELTAAERAALSGS